MSRMTREQLVQVSKDELDRSPAPAPPAGLAVCMQRKLHIIIRQRKIIEVHQARIERLEARVSA